MAAKGVDQKRMIDPEKPCGIKEARTELTGRLADYAEECRDACALTFRGCADDLQEMSPEEAMAVLVGLRDVLRTALSDHGSHKMLEELKDGAQEAVGDYEHNRFAIVASDIVDNPNLSMQERMELFYELSGKYPNRPTSDRMEDELLTSMLFSSNDPEALLRAYEQEGGPGSIMGLIWGKKHGFSRGLFNTAHDKAGQVLLESLAAWLANDPEEYEGQADSLIRTCRGGTEGFMAQARQMATRKKRAAARKRQRAAKKANA